MLQRVKDHLTSTEVLDLCHQKKHGDNIGIRELLGQKRAVLVAFYMRNKHQLLLMSTDGEFPFMGFGRYLKITPGDSNMVTWRWSGQRGQGTCALYQLRKALAGKDSRVSDEGSELVPGLSLHPVCDSV